MGLNLLLVEDDASLVAMMEQDLLALGHSVTIATDGRAAIEAVARDRFDAMVLDLMLPTVDGMSVLQRIRSEDMSLPVVILSALGRPIEKVEGLDAGADDYVVKPVSAAELNARINAILRGRRQPAQEGDTLRAGDLVVSPARFRAWRDGKGVDLSKLEFNLLLELVRNADSIVTRAMLLEKVWGYDFEPSTNLVDVHIRRLRTKLMAQGGDDPITTVRGVGYMLPG
jgi:two-component system, OmpR family, response regulator